jgi:hypothetical protein
MPGKFFVILCLCSFLSIRAIAQIRHEDKLRYLEAIRISKAMGDNVWPGFSTMPFATLFIYDSVEYLANHPHPPSAYTFIAFDSMLNSDIYKSKRSWPPALLACAPVNNYPTLLTSSPEVLKARSSTWILKLLHERFHQNQFLDSLLRDISALKLKVTDASFPYDSPTVNESYKNYRNALATTLQNIDNSKFRKSFKNCIRQKRSFRKSLSADEYQYFSLMLWMEGIARYTEFKFLEQLRDYPVSPAVASLEDFIPFRQLEQKELSKEQSYLAEVDLSVGRKTCWYTIGYAEGMILDKVAPNWKLFYWKERFNIDQYYKKRRN